MIARFMVRTVAVALLAAVLLATAACGGDDSAESESDAATPAAEGPASTQSPKGESTAAANGKTDPVAALKFKKGENSYTMMVDGLKRQFIVYVPNSYSASKPAPLVFVFHMTAHNGGYAFKTTRWKEQCDKESCIAVFPTAMSYFVIAKNTNQTKWNDTTLVQLVPPGTRLADDVQFVRKMTETLSATFSIDAKRVYASGASNGGMFVSSRILTEATDLFAAAGVNLLLTTQGQAPKNGEPIPAYVTYGGSDELVIELFEDAGLPQGKVFPMEAEQIMQNPGLGAQIANGLTTLGLESSYTVEYCAPKLNRCTATYSAALESSEALYTTLTFAKGKKPGVELRFRMIKGMGHAYATPTNNNARLTAAEYEWKFFTEHPKP